MQRKSPFRRRRGKSISATIKPICSVDAVLHLFGNSLHHLIDAVLSSDQSKKRILKENKEKLPEADQIRFERIITKIRKHEADLSEILARGLHSVGYPSEFPDTLAGLIEHDFESGAERLFGSGLVLNLAYEGTSGQRAWQEMTEHEWVKHLQGEMAARKSYRTDDRREGKSILPPLYSIYVRLTPWLAQVVASNLEKRGSEGKEDLTRILKEFAKSFSAELGVDVVGIAVHRENHRDLHVHLVFSETREVSIETKRSNRALKSMVRQVASARIQKAKAEGKTGKEIGRNSVMAAVRAELEGQREVKLGMKRSKRTRSWRILGPSFRGKRALWEASGREEEVAKINDRPAHESRSFRSVVSEPAKRNEDLAKTYIDLWAEQSLTDRMSVLLNPEEEAQVINLGREAVVRYLTWGKDYPSLEDLIRQEIEREYDDIPGDLPRLRMENETLKKEAADLIEAKVELENAPESLQRPTFKRTVKRLIRAAKTMEALIAAGQVLLTTAPQIAEVIEKAAAEVSAEAAKAWVEFWEKLSALLTPTKSKPKKKAKEKSPE